MEPKKLKVAPQHLVQVGFGVMLCVGGVTMAMTVGRSPVEISIGVALAAGGVGVALWGVRKMVGRRQLLERGIRCQGTIVAVKESDVSFNDVTQWVIEYSYTDFRGQTHTAESDYMAPEAATQWKPGDAGAVRYDEKNPDVSLWVGREEH